MARIMVVDDDDTRRETVCASLRLAGFEARGVGSDQAVEVASRGHFPLALVDLMLHGTNGFELARGLRDATATRVVLTSEYHFNEAQLARIDCGAIGFVPRPYVIDELTGFLRAKLRASPLSTAAQTT
jgi:DNA-binding response OmpR family regulator